MTNNVNTISSDRNLIKSFERAYTMSLVVFDSIWMTLYIMLDPKESCKTNLIPRGKRWCITHCKVIWTYITKTRSFYLVTSLLIHLKSRMICCVDYHFNETIFPPLGGEELVLEEWHQIIWNALTLTHLNHRTNQCELEVQKIIHLQELANQVWDTFINAKKVTKIIFTN